MDKPGTWRQWRRLGGLLILATILANALPPSRAQGVEQSAQSGPQAAAANNARRFDTNQGAVTLFQNYGGFLTEAAAGDPLAIGLGYVNQHLAEFGLSKADLKDLTVTDRYVSANNGVTHLYLRQRINGIDVVGTSININVMPDGRILSIGNQFMGDLGRKFNLTRPQIASGDALLSSAAYLGLAARGLPTPLKAPEGVAQATSFAAPELSADPIPVKLVYQPLGPDGLRLAWSVTLRLPDGSRWLELHVDAATGDVLTESDWIVDESGAALPGSYATTDVALNAPAASAAAIPEMGGGSNAYNVYALPKRFPADGPRTLVPLPADALASPFGWHDTNGAAGPEFTITRGNNAYAYTDTDANNVPDPGSSPDGTANLLFNFPIDLAQEPDTYAPAAVTNLFYISNMIHDILYHYGFTEDAGNFQTNNYGRGGQGNDYVQAEAHDGGGFVNANFGTPPDGQLPRMQMYLGARPYSLVVNAPAGIAGEYGAGTASFGPATYSVTGDLALGTDATAPFGDGCQAITSNVTGKIAVIDRGSCGFAVKAANAQAAGAIGVLIVNNAIGSAPGMGGSDPNVTIPAMSVSLADGNIIKSAISQGTVSVTLSQGGARRDGSLDNGVIIHEYGHGVSNRLTGGPNVTSCLEAPEEQGEGWSDAISLVLTALPTDTAATAKPQGNWLNGQPVNAGGFRRFPYTTNLAVNPLTYAAVALNTEVHALGEVWTSMFWEVYWNLVDKYGFSSNLYTGTAGNTMALQLLLDGMKLQPCNPTFTEARDGILAADVADNAGANQCLIWEGFAKRGLGWSADSGLRSSATDGVQAFDMPPSCTLNATPPEQEVCAPASATYNVNLGPDFADTVTLSVLGKPAGTTATFTTNPITPTQSSLLTIGNTAAATPGLYHMQLVGMGQTATYTTPLELHLANAIPTVPTLVSPADGATSVPLRPTLSWNAAAQGHTYILEVASDANFTAIVYTTTTTATSAALPDTILGGRPYWWRVRSVNECGTGLNSAASFFIVRTTPAILLVDDDGDAPDVRGAYAAALDSMGLAYDVFDANFDVGEPSAAGLSNYEMVIWAGGQRGSPGGDGEVALANFLDQGNCLFVSSQEYFAVNGVTSLMRNYLGVNAVMDDAIHSVITGTNAYNGFGPYNLPAANNFSDLLTPSDGQVAFMGNKGVVGVSKATGVYTTTYLAFRLDALPAAAVAGILDRALERCGTAAQTPDLAVDQATVSDPTVLPGQPVTYTLSFTNQGNWVAESIVISDTLPSTLTDVSVTSSGAPITPVPDTTYAWTLDTLDPGESGVITITGKIDPTLSADASVANTVEIRGLADAGAGNNLATTTLQVVLPRVSLMAATANVGEGDGTVTLTVTLNIPNPYVPVRVLYATADATATDGSDYDGTSGNLTVAAGATSATVVVPIFEDNVAEGDETFTLTLTSPSGGALGVIAASVITIADNDDDVQLMYLPVIIR